MGFQKTPGLLLLVSLKNSGETGQACDPVLQHMLNTAKMLVQGQHCREEARGGSVMKRVLYSLPLTFWKLKLCRNCTFLKVGKLTGDP